MSARVRPPRFPPGELDGITHAAGTSRSTNDSEKDTPQAESATYNSGLQCTAIPDLPINTVKSSLLRMRTAFRFLGPPPLASGHISKQWWGN